MMRVIGRAELIDEPRCAPPIVDMAVVHEIRAILDAGVRGPDPGRGGAP